MSSDRPKRWEWSENMTGSAVLETPLLSIWVDTTAGRRWGWKIYDGGRRIVLQSTRTHATRERAKREALERLIEGFARQVERGQQLLGRMG